MMDARRPCPDSALLAAFLDGALDGYERAAVVNHLTECAECRAVAVAVVEFREIETQDQPAPVRVRAHVDEPGEPRAALWSRRKTRAPSRLLVVGVLLGATIALTLWRLLPLQPVEYAVSTLVDAADGQRPTHARLSGGFAFAPARDTAGPEPGRTLRLVSIASHIRDDYGADYAPSARRAVGIAALLVGDLDDAVASLSIASLAAPDDARAANDLAAAYYERAVRAKRADDLPRALDAAERAVQLQPALLEAWFNRALIITALGLKEEARTAWREYWQRDPDSPWADEARERARALDVGAPQVAWTTLERKIETSDDAAAADNAVRMYSTQARAWFETRLEEWTAAAERGADARAARLILARLGDAFARVHGDRFYQDVALSIEEARAAGDQLALATAHREFLDARTVAASNDPERAHGAFRRSAERLAAVASPLVLRAQIEAATACYFLGHYDEAVASLVEPRQTAAARSYRWLATRGWWIAGLAEYGRNDLAAARVAYEEMLESARPPADVEELVNAHLLLGNLHDIIGDNNLAWRHRVTAMSLVDGIDSTPTRANVFLSAAGHAMAGGHYAAALLFESRLLALGGELNPISAMQARTQHATILLRLGRRDAARAELERAQRQLPEIADPLMAARQATDLFELESMMAIADDPARAMQLAEQGADAAARTGERFRVSRLQLRLAEAAIALGDLGRADDAIARSVAAFQELRSADPATAPSDHELPLLATAARVALHRGDLARAFEYSERRRLRTMYEMSAHPAAPLTLADVQARLDDRTAVALVNQFDDQLDVWIITHDDVAVHRATVPMSHAAALVASHLQEVAHGSETPRVSGELFDLLMRPHWARLQTVGTLAVIADAPYRQVALAALWDRTRGRYLVEDLQLVSAPSATTFLRQPATASPSHPAGEGIGILNASAAARPSPSRESVVGELVTFYEVAQLRTGRAATPSELLAQIAQRDVVHIAAPVAGDGTRPTAARLLVADEPGRKYSGSISAGDLATAAVRARLVALDTGTADGMPAASDAAPALAEALLAAGVETVVGPVGAHPRRDLDRLWLEFHRQYAAGFAAADSLRRAQLAALGASNRRVGPWATLAVFGANQ